jgi:hypothetical protein
VSAAPVMPIARRGDRHSDSTRFEDAEGATLLGAVLGDVFADAEGFIGALGAQIGAGLTEAAERIDVTVRRVVGRRVTGALEWVSQTVFLGTDRLLAALVDPDDESDAGDDEKLESGAAAVFVDGRRVGRAGDQTADGNTVFEGDVTILIGGAPTPGEALDPTQIASAGLEALLGAAVGAVLTHPDVQATAAEWGQWAQDAQAGAQAVVTKAQAAVHEAQTAVESAAATAAKAGDWLDGDASGAIGALLGSTLGA